MIFTTFFNSFLFYFIEINNTLGFIYMIQHFNVIQSVEIFRINFVI